jgi:hypothetical protein
MLCGGWWVTIWARNTPRALRSFWGTAVNHNKLSVIAVSSQSGNRNGCVKVKVPGNRPEGQEEGRGIAPLFLYLGARRGEWSAPRTGGFTPGKDPVPIVQEAGWAPGPVWTCAKNLAPHLNSIPRTTQPIASRYTDWAIPAPERIAYKSTTLCADLYQGLSAVCTSGSTMSRS